MIRAEPAALFPLFLEHFYVVKKLKPSARLAEALPPPLLLSGAWFPVNRRRHVVVEGAIREARPHDAVVAKFREIRINFAPLYVLR